MAKRKICVATATRAEYGLLRWLMREVKDAADLELQVIVTGAHLSPTYGLTFEEIEREGFAIDAKVDMELSAESGAGIAKSMGRCAIGFADALERLRPDILVVLGDRYELLSICAVATVMSIPIAHVSGGDLTEGAIDDQVRHSVTKLAHLHFPGTQESADRILQMGEQPSRVFAVGEPGLDNFLRTPAMARAELAASLELSLTSRWVLFTYHPETTGTVAVDVRRVRDALDALAALPDVEVVMTHPNADLGGIEIAAVLEERHASDPKRFKLHKSLGQNRFVAMMREAWSMVGNSSAGVVEAPAVKLAVVNIGARQSGRPTAVNVVTVPGDRASIDAAIHRFDEPEFRAQLAQCESPYGDGRSAARIKEVLANVPLDGLLRKPFHAPDRR